MSALTALKPATKPEVRIVRVASLKIDPTYQRPVNELRVERMAAEWNDDLAGAITVSERSDGFYVADGQHRLVAARRAGVIHLPAIVHSGLSQSEEASLFAAINTGTVRPSALAIFRARVIAADPVAEDIARVVAKCGCIIAYNQGRQSKQPNSTSAVSALERAYDAVGALGLEYTLRTCTTAWPDADRALDAPTITGVSGFLYTYQHHPLFRPERLSEKLAERPVRGFIQRAKDLGGSSSSATGGTGKVKAGPVKAALEAYNRGLRGNHLPEPTLTTYRFLAAGRNPWVEQ